MRLLDDYMDVMGWERPKELLGRTPDLWGSYGILPNGIKQSATLGDCWFLSAASAMAEFPARI